MQGPDTQGQIHPGFADILVGTNLYEEVQNKVTSLVNFNIDRTFSSFDGVPMHETNHECSPYGNPCERVYKGPVEEISNREFEGIAESHPHRCV